MRYLPIIAFPPSYNEQMINNKEQFKSQGEICLETQTGYHYQIILSIHNQLATERYMPLAARNFCKTGSKILFLTRLNSQNFEEQWMFQFVCQKAILPLSSFENYTNLPRQVLHSQSFYATIDFHYVKLFELIEFELGQLRY